MLFWGAVSALGKRGITNEFGGWMYGIQSRELVLTVKMEGSAKGVRTLKEFNEK